MSGKKLSMLSLAWLLVLVVLVPAVQGRSAPAATYTVTKADDSGGGTLRDAIEWAQSHTGADEIHFSISGTGCLADVCTIQLANPLPTLTNVVGLIIDGYTQPGAEPPDGNDPAKLKIVIDGNGNNCFVVTGANHLIRGLVIQDCYHSVEITGSNAHDNVIAGNHIGTDAAGSAAAGNRHGVYIRSGAHHNTIGGDEPAERNVISGNTYYGIWIEGLSYSNTVSANYIGTKAWGTSSLPNGYSGVHITGGNQNTIGGDAPGEANVISGNSQYGVRIRGSNTGNNVVSGNVIGADYEAAVVVPNTLAGVYIAEGASYNRIGGSTAGEQNVIAGNDGDGVWIEGAYDNVVAGNLIGLNAWDWSSLGNADGVQIDGGAQDNTIGGDTASERNVISGNGECGVRLEGEGTTGNVVSGNYIGTDTTGVRGIDDLGNGQDGVLIVNGAAENVVGGALAGERNVIADNTLSGVAMYGTDTMSNTIAGNYIGVNAPGTAALGNGVVGVYLASAARGNMIGGDTAGERNVIAGNLQDGVQIGGEGTVDNVVAGNYIGVDPSGLAAMANQHDGVLIHGSACRNRVGDNNVISGNQWSGVAIYGAATMTNTVSGNYIGTNAGGTAAVANGYYGVYIGNASDHNVVGLGNVISGNTQDGVRIELSATDYNRVSGNYIGTNGAGTALLVNGWDGVRITGGARYNTIGGASGEGNLVAAGTNLCGVHVDVNGTMNNVISGNLIGTNASGMAALSTAAYGVCLDNGAGYNTVGGKTVGERNVISGNWLGVWLSGADTSYNKLFGNYIGLSASGTAAVPNTAAGIYLITGADHTTIGGTGAGERNVISGNAYDGVSIYGSDTDSNTVAGNYIGTDANGTLPLGNGYEGVKIYGDCDNNVVGAGNVIAYNARNGVLVDQSNQSSALGNRITQNSIHDNGLAGIDLANSANGSIAVPVLTAVSYGATIDISGTACGGCTVEVLGSTANDGEGEVYLGSALAEAGGAFVLSLDTLGQPYLTATATDAIKGTSEFSAPYEAPALRLRIYLPLVVRKQALSW